MALLLTGAIGVIGALYGQSGKSVMRSKLWERDNLHVWGLAPFDANQRSPEERAQLLQKLGFKSIAYNWRGRDVPLFGEQIETFKRYGINVMAWSIYDADDPTAKVDWAELPLVDPGPLMTGSGIPPGTMKLKELLEILRQHNVHPQLWVVQPVKKLPYPKPLEQMSEAELREWSTQHSKGERSEWRDDLPKTPKEQEDRVNFEAGRINALVKLTAPYGIKVCLYNHNGWYGFPENQLEVLERLKQLGTTNVGIAYNFIHARDYLHDDTRKFAALWKRMQPYVVAVNLSGTRSEQEPKTIPSQGDRELEMMRVIQESGWRGSVGLLAETGGDAAITLQNCLTGLDWLAAELAQPGSGGPRPFPPTAPKS